MIIDKFIALGSYLSKQTEARLRLSFSEIERIVGFKLCDSAYKYTAYWHPSKTHVLPNLIISYGYNIEKVDLTNKIIYLSKQN